MTPAPFASRSDTTHDPGTDEAPAGAGRHQADAGMDDPGTEAAHLLIVDDDTRILGLLRRYLSDRGFVVSTASDAAEARRHLAAVQFDLLVVDLMMPGEDGLSLTRSLRDSGSAGVPIVMLTARDQPEDRILGLECGADDYLAKPFDPRELVLRITAILRRARPAPPPAADSPPPAAVGPIALGGCLFDPRQDLLLRDGVPVHLTTSETALLRVLARHVGETVSREDLAAHTGADGTLRTIDVQVTRLRKKIEDDPRAPRHLLTVRGTGYRLRPG